MSIHTPSLDDLRLFITLIRHKSLSDCANDLGVSTANISKRLAQLEQKMGLKLMHRTTRKISLTEVGETFAEWGQRVLDCSQEMMEAVSAEKTIPRGTLRVCSSSGFGRARVAPALSELLRTYPDLEIQLELLDRPVDLITEGFHLDIRLGAVEEPDMICRKILSNRRILCASADYLDRKPAPKTLNDLQDHNCLVIRERDQQSGRWALQGPQGEETIRVRSALSSNNGESVRQWIIDGYGIGLRSLWDISSALQQKKIFQVLPEYYQEANVCAVYPSRLASSARLRVCVEFLVEWLKQENCS